MTTALQLIEVKPGKKFPLALLKTMLPDVETILFFGKAYSLNVHQVSNLLYKVKGSSSVATALSSGDHSTSLQDYLVDLAEDLPELEEGDLTFAHDVKPKGEILPHMWESIEVEIASSIQEVIAKLDPVLDKMPGKQGHMLFKSMLTMNKQRPTLGDYRATINHPPAPPNLVVFDVSGSMSESTVRAIVDDVVALSVKANAHLAIVSNSTTVWEPGTFTSDSVMQAAEFGGTHYETLLPLFQRDWGTVVSIADYDSSYDVPSLFRKEAKGRVRLLLDVSLVDKPTFLAEVLSNVADEVRPILVASRDLC